VKKTIIVCDKCGMRIIDEKIYYLSGSMSNDLNSLSVLEVCKACATYNISNNYKICGIKQMET
jgi:hypothetical protein